MRRSLKNGSAVVTAIVMFIARSAGAQTTVLDFESLACTGATTNFTYSASPFIIQGYQLSASFGYGFATPCSGRAGVSGSAALYNYYGNSVTTLTKVGGGAFDLVSIDLADYYYYLSPLSLTFTGTPVAGGSVFQTFSIPGSRVSQTWATYAFGSAFDNVTSVAWQSSLPYHEFDNITIGGVVPEPATVSLLATGLVGMAGARLRRRRKQA